jgi:4-amino-4-deoxy-L-arabinose transferase-like glycosyltransferase
MSHGDCPGAISGSRRFISSNFWVQYESATLLAIVLAGLAVRLYGITLPYVDSHNIRQTQVAIVARNLYANHMNIFCTSIDVFGKVSGCTIYEFPIVHSLAALLYYVFGIDDIIGRLLPVAFSMGAILLMYRLATLFLPAVSALGATALYAFSPMNIYFSRAFMAESSMLFFILASVYFTLRWLEQQKVLLYVVAVLCTTLAFLAKTTAVFLMIPLCCAWFVKYGWSILRRADFWIYAGVTLGAIATWTIYGHVVNANNPAMPESWKYGALLGARGAQGVWKVWLDPSSYWKLGGSVVLLVLTPIGVLVSLVGILTMPSSRYRPVRYRPVMYAWLGSIILYFFVFAGANAGHVYYQLVLLPVAALLFGYGLEYIVSRARDSGNLLNGIDKRAWISLIGLLGVLYTVGYVEFFSYMYDPRARMPYLLEVAGIIKTHTPADSVLVVSQPGAMLTPIAYYADRKCAWFDVAHGERAISELERSIQEGGTTYVAIDTKYGSGVEQTKRNTAFWEYLNKTFRPIALTDHYLIFDLVVSQ